MTRDDVAVGIQLLVSAPQLDPDELGRALGLQPSLVLKAGDPVVTPKGRQTGDFHRATSWSLLCETASDDAEGVASEIRRLVHAVARAGPMLRRIRSAGGRAYLTIYVSSPCALEIAVEDLGVLRESQVALGVVSS